jgi:uncharacterized protein (DUF1800 family)
MSDPRAFLKAELTEPGIALLAGSNLLSTDIALQSLFDSQRRKKAEREQLAAKAHVAASDSQGPDQGQAAQNIAAPAGAALPPQQQIYRAEALARARRAIESRVGLAERLVAFWSNHFCVSAAKGPLGRITAGSFEREAIRPYVLGCFGDMVRAVASHPAMLNYLDNARSVGVNSPVGLKRNRGLNENFAREIMELHVLGVGSGYSQKDVTSLAQILTGWTLSGPDGRLGEPGKFVFNADAHEPGPQIFLDKSYVQEGLAQGEAALNDIVHRPSTATFIAGKFTQHFVTDDPPPSLVTHLAEVFRSSDGDLKALTYALIDSDEAWTAPLTKVRNPYEFLIAANRAIGYVPDEPEQILGPLNLLGMGLWAPPSPNGYPDDSATWASPESLNLRLDLAAKIAAQVRDPPNPSDLFEAITGAGNFPVTHQAIARAETKQQGLALLLMSPEIQRR